MTAEPPPGSIGILPAIGSAGELPGEGALLMKSLDRRCLRGTHSLDFSAPPSRTTGKNGVQVSKPVSLWNDLLACGPNPRESIVPLGGPRGDPFSVSPSRTQGRLDRRRIGHTSIIVPLGGPRGESPQTPRAVPSPSVPQGRFRGRRKDPLGGRGGRKIRASSAGMPARAWFFACAAFFGRDLWAGDGSSFQAPYTLPAAGRGTLVSVDAGDLDGDGALDLAAISS